MTTKSLDEKLARIHADPACKDFILADAKDADMAFGMAAPGSSPEYHAQEARFRSLADYRDLMRQNIRQGLVDIMLMSSSSSEQLTIIERLFDNSPVTPAARANDTTDIHLATASHYRDEPSQPFRTSTIDHIMCGKVDCLPQQRSLGADLGLYSVTFNNNLDRDLDSINAYRDFRIEAERKEFRHFLEVFDPNACGDHCPPPQELGRFINDQIARTLGGVAGKGRPIFLKIAYHGPQSMEQLAYYDRHLVPGILGGSAGTTYDAFYQLWEAKKYGAKAALYGRMINSSEDQLTFIQHLRWLADGEIDDPGDAVRSYHASLEKIRVRPYRSLSDDLLATHRVASYGGVPVAAANSARSSLPHVSGQSQQMSTADKVAWNLKKWDRVLS